MRVYFALARCQYVRSCQDAATMSARAEISSPDFLTPAQLDVWLSRLMPSDRRCRCCGRQIAARHFERRTFDPSVSPHSSLAEAADG